MIQTNKTNRRDFFAILHKKVILWCCLIAVIVSLVSVLPILLNSNFEILDDPFFYKRAQNINWTEFRTYIFMPHTKYLARPGFFVILLPACIATNPLFHYLIQTIVVLAIPLMLISLLIYRITKRWWLSAFAPILCVLHASFTENYYTLLKQDTFVLTGSIIVTFLLWDLLYNKSQQQNWIKKIALIIIALIGVVFTYTIKETGGAFLGVYIVGLIVLGWGAGLTVMKILKRTFLLTLLNLFAFGVLVAFFLRLESHYSAGGSSSYSVRPSDLLSGVYRLGAHFIITASYVFPAFLILLFGIVVFFRNKNGSDIHRVLRIKIAWSLYFFLFFLGMSAVLIPWQSPEARHYLVAAITAVIATVCAIDLGFFLLGKMKNIMAITTLISLLVVVFILLFAHGTYGALVGLISEGRTRQHFDETYGNMFRYIAENTPSNGTAYFMIDKKWPEPVRNSRLAMELFYNRPDINCVYPSSVDEFNVSGLVAVTEFNIPMNYDRMPLHHEMSMKFNREIKNKLPVKHKFKTFYDTSIWYAQKKYHGMQYKSVFGIPAFWNLKKGNYKFGWNVYYFNGNNNNKIIKINESNKLINSKFNDNLQNWSYWNQGNNYKKNIKMVDSNGTIGKIKAVRIENPMKKLVGIQQRVRVVSNTVYKLSGIARTLGNDKSKIFGGRIALWLPPQKEKQIVWMSKYNQWWKKDLIFTNQVTGIATVYVHMGYGGVASTGEFTNIRLELIE